MKIDHKQALTDYGFKVDEELVELINLFQYNGIKTNNSCQNQEHCGNMTWICFDNYNSVKTMLQTIKKIDKEFYNYLHQQQWNVVFDIDNTIDYLIKRNTYNYSLRFPYTDLNFVTNKFRSIYKWDHFYQ